MMIATFFTIVGVALFQLTVAVPIHEPVNATIPKAHLSTKLGKDHGPAFELHFENGTLGGFSNLSVISEWTVKEITEDYTTIGARAILKNLTASFANATTVFKGLYRSSGSFNVSLASTTVHLNVNATRNGFLQACNLRYNATIANLKINLHSHHPNSTLSFGGFMLKHVNSTLTKVLSSAIPRVVTEFLEKNATLQSNSKSICTSLLQLKTTREEPKLTGFFETKKINPL